MIQKKDLIDAVATESGLPPASAKKVLEALVTVAMRQMAAGKELKLLGLGKLAPRHRNARPGRNPKTGEPAEIPASTTVRFSPSLALKAAVNPAPQHEPIF